jgi:hypothetical protein
MAFFRMPSMHLLLIVFSAAYFVSLCSADDYTFDLEEIEKKTFRFSGYAEINPVIYDTDPEGAFYKLRFYDRDQGSTLEKYDMTLQTEGDYEKGIARAFARINSNLHHTYEGWSGKAELYEGFMSLKPTPSLKVAAGKKTMKWGTGYAWSPVAFFDRPKDPDDPALDLEGFFVLTMDYIKSFSGPLKTVSLTPVVLPVYGDMNKDFGEARHLNFGAKAYFLFLDTDIDLMFLSGGSKAPRFGFDFSRNITSNFEIHGELAWIKDFHQKAINPDGGYLEDRSSAWSHLLGIRYLSTRETTYILEYYHNGAGFSRSEMEDFFSFVHRGYTTYLETGSDAMLRKASGLTQTGYGRMSPMRDYLYLRVSQKEPFDILYFTPSATCIFNLDDQSLSFSSELVYTGIDNLELRLKGAVLIGDCLSEYGEKQNDSRLELRARYYF